MAFHSTLIAGQKTKEEKKKKYQITKMKTAKWKEIENARRAAEQNDMMSAEWSGLGLLPDK